MKQKPRSRSRRSNTNPVLRLLDLEHANPATMSSLTYTGVSVLTLACAPQYGRGRDAETAFLLTLTAPAFQRVSALGLVVCLRYPFTCLVLRNNMETTDRTRLTHECVPLVVVLQ